MMQAGHMAWLARRNAVSWFPIPMRSSLVDLFQCPECGAAPLILQGEHAPAQEFVETGVLTCAACAAWYPVRRGIPRLLPRDNRAPAEDARFREVYPTLAPLCPLCPLCVDAEGDSADAPDNAASVETWTDVFQTVRHKFGPLPPWGEVYLPFRVSYWEDEPVASRRGPRNILPVGPHCYYGSQPMRDDIIAQFIAEARAAGRRGLRVLDLGCGAGRYREIFNNAGWEYIGVDITGELNAETQAVGYRLPFRDALFDCLICDGVLEHVWEPNAVVAEALRVLKPGADAYIYVPFLYKNHGAPLDFFRYTASGFHYLLRDFSSVAMYPLGGFFSSLSHIVWAVTTLADRVLPYSGVLLRVPLYALFRLLIPFDRFDRYKVICRGYYAIARK